MKKPRVVNVATGGTIAGAAASNIAAGYTSAALAVDTLIAAVPQVKWFAEIRGVQVDDDKVGTVVAKELNPSKARVLLKLSLTKTADPKMVQEFFNRY